VKLSTLIFTASLVGCWSELGIAQTTTALNAEATQMNTLAASQGETKVVDKISSDFSSFLGADSKAVVTGLRNGTPITLTSTAPSTGTTGVTTTDTTIINPPTGKMGHGNVFISLALAKQQLGTMGITEPTPQQLQAALTGGQITTTTGATTATGTPTSAQNLDGILTMRSQNMGWGQIAQKLGYKLGPVISSMKHTNQNLTTTTSTTTGATVKNHGQVNKSSQSGIVSAGGQSHGNSSHGTSSGKGSGSGIVSASGKVSGSGYGHTHGKSNIVTGPGHSAGSGGAVSGGGNGSGHGKGHSK
jgi:hypothetical protein